VAYGRYLPLSPGRFLEHVDAESLHLRENLANPLDQAEAQALLPVGVAQEEESGEGLASDPPRTKRREHLVDEGRDLADPPLPKPDRREIEPHESSLECETLSKHSGAYL
jgi:hypothetical protein